MMKIARRTRSNTATTTPMMQKMAMAMETVTTTMMMTRTTTPPMDRIKTKCAMPNAANYHPRRIPTMKTPNKAGTRRVQYLMATST